MRYRVTTYGMGHAFDSRTVEALSPQEAERLASPFLKRHGAGKIKILGIKVVK